MTIIGLTISISRHGKQRLKQRVHGNPQKAAEDALYKGLTHNELNGSLKDYVDWLAMTSKQGPVAEYRVYYDNIYLFGRGPLLITVLHIPVRHRKLALKLTQEKKASIVETPE